MSLLLHSAINRPVWSPFDPRVLPGCGAWFDAADSRTLVLNGSNVSLWMDKSSNGYDVRQLSTVSQPILSGQSVVFNGRTTVLQTLTPVSIRPTNMFAVVTSYYDASIVTVSTPLLCNSFRSVFSIIDSVNNTESYFRERYTQGTRYQYQTIVANQGGTQWEVQSLATLVCNSISNFILSERYQACLQSRPDPTGANRTLSHFFDGTRLLSTWNPGLQIVSQRTLGVTQRLNIGSERAAAGWWYGEINEVILYDRMLSDFERYAMEGYLAWKWNTVSRLSANHPYRYYPPYYRSFLPTDIPDCDQWYDSDDPNSLVLSGSNVSEWRNKSGYDEDYIQVSDLSRPTLSIGSGGILFQPGKFLSSAFIQTGRGGRESFLVYTDLSTSSTGSGNPPVVFMGVSTVSGSSWRTGFNASANQLWINITNGIRILSSPTAGVNIINNRNVLHWGISLNGSNTTAYAFGNGTQFASVSTGTTTVVLSMTTTNYINHIGGGIGIGDVTGGISGIVHEYIYYGRGLLSYERQQVEGYLAWKWGIQSNLLLSTHPYQISKMPVANNKFIPPIVAPSNVLSMIAWYDAADSSSIVLGSGNSVSQWNDKSGNGFHLSNVSSVSQPSYLSSSDINSRPAIAFDGISQFLQNAGGLPLIFGGNDVPKSIFMAYRFSSLPASTVSSGTLYSFYYGGGTSVSGLDAVFVLSNAWRHIRVGMAGALVSANTSTVPAAATNYLYSQTHNGTTALTTAINGLVDPSINSVNFNSDTMSTANGVFTIGGFTRTTAVLEAALSGQIAELIVYRGALTFEYRMKIEGYLANKWRLQTVLPLSHAFKYYSP